MPDLKIKVPDFGVKVPDRKLEVPDLRSGGIRLNLTPAFTCVVNVDRPAVVMQFSHMCDSM